MSSLKLSASSVQINGREVISPLARYLILLGAVFGLTAPFWGPLLLLYLILR